jgi:hypothetical protein
MCRVTPRPSVQVRNALPKIGRGAQVPGGDRHAADASKRSCEPSLRARMASAYREDYQRHRTALVELWWAHPK